MKQKYLILFGALLASSASKAQTFSDNFDSYKSGDNLAATSAVWETWGSPNGGADDVKVTSTKAKSGANSLYFQSTAANGGPADLVLPFGGAKNTGTFSLKMWMQGKTHISTFKSKPLGVRAIPLMFILTSIKPCRSTTPVQVT